MDDERRVVLDKMRNESFPFLGMTTNKTCIDLFCGAGGSSLGFKRAGFDIVCAVEVDAVSTYRHNIGAPVLHEDIRKIDPSDLRERLGMKKGELFVLLGCPPCQGFSEMRKDGEKDPRNDLVETYGDFVREFMPQFLVFENVPGILKKNYGKKFFDSLKSYLSEIGYFHKTYLLNAADYGVPQIRKRVFLIASVSERTLPNLEKYRTHGPPEDSEVQAGKLKPWVTVREAIGHLPPLKPGEKDPAVPNHRARDLTPKTLRIITAVPKNGGSRKDVPKHLWLDCHRRQRGYNDVFGRLAWDKPSNVITSGCTSVTKGRFAHPEQDRGLTPREAAVLQGFPEDFVFFGGMDSVSRQIGNAVPPPLAEIIALSLIESFEKQ